MSDLDDLAATLDPDVFDPDRKFSKQPAAVVQVAARRHMAYEGAERVLAAGWAPPARHLGSVLSHVAAERDALVATVQRVREMCDEWGRRDPIRSIGHVDEVRAALDDPGEEG